MQISGLANSAVTCRQRDAFKKEVWQQALTEDDEKAKSTASLLARGVAPVAVVRQLLPLSNYGPLARKSNVATTEDAARAAAEIAGETFRLLSRYWTQLIDANVTW